jgi:hypothetical protein
MTAIATTTVGPMSTISAMATRTGATVAITAAATSMAAVVGWR